MGLDTKHPLYIDRLPDWIVLEDTFAGERTIKEAGVSYLPATSGQVADGMGPTRPGGKAYASYVRRASFPSVVADAVGAMIGVMHHKPPTIELPSALEPLLITATLQGESLEMLLRRINERQLVEGRIGLLLDVPDGQQVGTPPYIATYSARSIINWDEGTRTAPGLANLNLVVLDESEYERGASFTWDMKRKYRVLVLGDVLENEAVGQGVYQVGVFEGNSATFSKVGLITPSIGGLTLDKIPFVFINSKDVVTSPDKPPLLGLSELALTIYRGDADHRQALFMQGQDTLVISGGTEDEYRVGANAQISLGIGGDAKYIGVESNGLKEMRSALEDDRREAAAKGAQLLDTTSRSKESGDALRVRVAAQTATLNQIALTGAFGLELILKDAATWVGANPDDVSVTPNLDFTDQDLAGKTLVEWMTAKSLGAPLSLLSIHKQMQDKDLTDMTFEEEMEQLADEAEKFGEEEPEEELDDMETDDE